MHRQIPLDRESGMSRSQPGFQYHGHMCICKTISSKDSYLSVSHNRRNKVVGVRHSIPTSQFSPRISCSVSGGK